MSDGRVAYIEPMAFAHTDSSWVLAGEPLYTWRYPTGERPQPDTSHALIGVLFTRGSARPLPRPPVRGVVTHIRMLAEGNHYRAVFAETDGSAAGPRRPRVLAYWSARTDGSGWDQLEPLPLPPDSLDPAEASSLVRVGDALMIAVPYGPLHRRGVAVYAARQDGWRRQDIFTDATAYVALAASQGNALLYVVRPDSTRRPDSNSLTLFVPADSGWRDAGFVLRGGSRPVHRPTVSVVGNTTLLSWHEEDSRSGAFHARAAELQQDGTLGTVVTLGERIDAVMPVRGASRTHQWVVSRRAIDGSAMHLLVEWTSAAPRTRDVIADPFTGPSLAHALGAESVIVGPVVSHAPTDEFLVSGILRFVNRCDSSVAR